MPLARRWDLRDDCLIISGQMRHFAPDFIAFLIHYSCLTSRGGNAIPGQTATGRGKLTNFAKLSGDHWRRRGHQTAASESSEDTSQRSSFLRLRRLSGRSGPISAPGRFFSQQRSDEHVCVVIHNIMDNSASPWQRSLRRPISGTLLCQICWYPHSWDGCRTAP